MLIDADDVLHRWAGTAPDDQLLFAYLHDAETLLRFAFPNLDTQIEDDTIPLDRVKFVLTRMVMRILRNPDNVRQQSAGPFSVTYASAAPGTLYMTAQERGLLSGDPMSTGHGAYTIDPTPTDADGDPIVAWLGGWWDDPVWL